MWCTSYKSFYRTVCKPHSPRTCTSRRTATCHVRACLGGWKNKTTAINTRQAFCSIKPGRECLTIICYTYDRCRGWHGWWYWDCCYYFPCQAAHRLAHSKRAARLHTNAYPTRGSVSATSTTGSPPDVATQSTGGVDRTTHNQPCQPNRPHNTPGDVLTTAVMWVYATRY